MSAIALKGLSKHFGATVAVRSIDLSIESGELFFLLGPSGCGKTTLLRMIAGFIEPTSGSIHFGDREVTNVPPNRRNCGMVFQSYALWPHMTVADNVAYGLRVRKVAAEALSRRVDAALRLVHMEAYGARKPNQLSGGQQQRVALARALVIEPTVLLLDEPLSNLDAKLRSEMRTEIRRICKQAGITTVYVTHDQKEALSMADRIAVMRAGGVEQVGPPHLLYRAPISRFVADFLGETNFLTGVIKASPDGGALTIETTAGPLRAAAPRDPGAQPAPGSRVTCSIRPEAVHLGGSPGENTIRGRLVSTTYFGETAQHRVQLSDSTTISTIELNPTTKAPDAGSTVSMRIDAEAIAIVQD